MSRCASTLVVGTSREPEVLSALSPCTRTSELGGHIAIIRQALTITDHHPGGIGVRHFFLARLVSWDVRARHGPEFSEPGRGSYELVRCPCVPEAIAQIDLVPHAVSEFLQRNAEELRALASSSAAANGAEPGAGRNHAALMARAAP